jgi:hypothetical protein
LESKTKIPIVAKAYEAVTVLLEPVNAMTHRSWMRKAERRRPCLEVRQSLRIGKNGSFGKGSE